MFRQAQHESIMYRDVAPFIVSFFLAIQSCAATSKSIRIPSTKMNKKFKARIILPDSYKKTEKKYSVIYLLHGFGRDHNSWATLVSLNEYADRHNLIFVCLNGNRNSWYLDSPIQRNSQFKTYIAQEVLQFIDKKYRTHASDKGRVLIGSSMGGHGALTIIAQHPKLFIGAGSISGILDLNDFPDKWELDRMLGPYESNKEQWSSNSFVNMINLLERKNRAIKLDCGIEDPAIESNRKAHQLMLDLKVSHEYNEQPGKHNQAFVKKVFESHVIYFSKILKPMK